MLVAMLKIIRWLAVGFSILGLLVFGPKGDVSRAILFTVPAFVAIRASRDWHKRSKLLGSAGFITLLCGVAVFSQTPKGKMAYIAEQLEEKQEAATEQKQQQLATAEQAHQQKAAAVEQARQQKTAAAQAAKEQSAQQAQTDKAATADAENEQNSLGSKIEAYNASQHFVTETLKSPGTTNYPGYPDSSVERIGNNTYSVSAYVDSQNSFGALIRGNWTAIVVEGDNDTWTCKDVNFTKQSD